MIMGSSDSCAQAYRRESRGQVRCLDLSFIR